MSVCENILGDIASIRKNLWVTFEQESAKKKDEKINEMMEELANMTAMYNENLEETEHMRLAQAELEELRELKNMIDDREKDQAGLIEGQGKQIEIIEKEYKEEQVMRKR